MSSLDAIKVAVEGVPAAATAHNAMPLLHEIRHALDKLAGSGEATVIDLSAIPFGPGDKEQLFTTLGEGEVQASVHALGDTQVNETRYPGVWLVRHLSPHGNELTVHVEVARLPSILATPQQDVAESAAALAEYLQHAPELPTLKTVSPQESS